MLRSGKVSLVALDFTLVPLSARTNLRVGTNTNHHMEPVNVNNCSSCCRMLSTNSLSVQGVYRRGGGQPLLRTDV